MRRTSVAAFELGVLKRFGWMKIEMSTCCLWILGMLLMKQTLLSLSVSLFDLSKALMKNRECGYDCCLNPRCKSVSGNHDYQTSLMWSI
jgi:hypothetical protein